MVLLKNSRFQLIFLYALLLPVLVVRILAESTNYCTPDSVYYLEVANNILLGKGAVGPKVFDFNEDENLLAPLYHSTPFGKPDQYEPYYFSVWPLGYPVAIAAVSLITGLDVLWASKLLNFILLGLDFYLLWLLFGKRAELIFFYFCSFTMLEILSYTWSENLYLSFFLLLLVALKKIHLSTNLHNITIACLSLALIGMSLARYASLIYFCFVTATMLRYFILKKYLQTISLFSGLLISSMAIGIYLYINYLKSGYISGMPRMDTQEFSAFELTKTFFTGLYNQLHIIKQFRYEGTVDFIYYCILSIAQLMLIGLVYRKMKDGNLVNTSDYISKLMAWFGFGYLIFLVVTTAISTIDPFDYRTLLPFSFPIFALILMWVQTNLEKLNEHSILTIIKLFFLCSLLLNLPKAYLYNFLFS